MHECALRAVPRTGSGTLTANVLDIAKSRDLDAARVTGDPTDDTLRPLAALAARLCDVPLAVISVDGEDEAPRSLADPLVAAACGYAFFVAEPLLTPDGASLGTLCLLAHAPLELTAEQHASLRAVAALAGDHVELLNRARAAERTAAQLQEALLSNRTIGKAIGLVMAQYRLDEEAAFLKLRDHSRDLNMKIRALAQQIVNHHNRGAGSPR